MSKNINLYNKYRPSSFKTLIGQEVIKKLILQIFKKEKLIQSFLFFGPNGTGKTSVARILAKAWNCLNFNGDDICNECENCRLINENRTIDISEIDAASNNGVEFVRELVQSVQYLPLDLKKKIYIIDESHNLSTSSWNALLKVIEETPEYVIFIFLTTNFQKIIPTIVSRCQKYNFSLLNQDELVKLISYVAENEKKEIELEAKNKIALFSSGSARQCLTYLEQLFLVYDSKIGLKEIEKVFCLTDKDTMLKFIDSIFLKNFSLSYEILENLHNTGKNLYYFYSYLLDILVDFIVYNKTKMLKNLKNIEEHEAKKFNKYEFYFLRVADVIANSMREFESFHDKWQWSKLTIFRIWDRFKEDEIKESISIENNAESSERSTLTLDPIEQSPLISEDRSKSLSSSISLPQNQNINNQKSINNPIPYLTQLSYDYEKDEPFVHDDNVFKLKTLSIYSKSINYFLNADLSSSLDQKIIYGIKNANKEKSISIFQIFKKYLKSERALPELVNIFGKIVDKFGLITSNKTIIIVFESPTDCHDFTLLFKNNRIREELKRVFFEDFQWLPLQHIFLPRYLSAAKASEKGRLKSNEVFNNNSDKDYHEILEILNN